MSVLLTIIGTVLLYVAIEAGIAGIVWAEQATRRYFKRRRRPDLFCDIEFTEADLTLQEECRQMLARRLPNGLADIRSLNSTDRQQLIRDIVDECNSLYQLEVDTLTFRPGEEIGSAVCGFYSPDSNSITINLDLLCTDTDSAVFSVLDTVFHEMRHAQQRKAITTDGYAFGSLEQQRAWAVNMVDYISAYEDYILYRTQTIELDATAFALNIVNAYKPEQQ